jgi:hypothetical protein
MSSIQAEVLRPEGFIEDLNLAANSDILMRYPSGPPS